MRWLRRVFFNLWYFRNPPWDTGISPPELLDHIDKNPSGRALDLGCGTGTNVITLAQHGWQAVGVDFAWRAIKIARRKARRAGVQVDLRVGDVTRLKNLSGTFDLILDMGCFHSLKPEGQSAYLENLERLLAPEGTFLLYAFFRDEDEAGPGLHESDLEKISQRLQLVERVNSLERRLLPSVWLTYQRKADREGQQQRAQPEHR